jgi:hypothetical protein
VKPGGAGRFVHVVHLAGDGLFELFDQHDRLVACGLGQVTLHRVGEPFEDVHVQP